MLIANKKVLTYNAVKLGFLALLSLSACAPDLQRNDVATPSFWSSNKKSPAPIVEAGELKEWWKGFHDEQLNWLVDQALNNSPDVKIAAAKIAEARGVEKSTKSSLFPQLTASAGAQRSRSTFVAPVVGNSNNAGFDASYEVDLFGKNRNAASAADAASRAAGGEYDWVKLSLIAEVARNYSEMRAAEKQITLMQESLKTQKETNNLVTKQRDAGGTSSFDVERSALLVNQLEARISDYRRLKEVDALSLITLTGLSADEIKAHTQDTSKIPALDIKPAIIAPAAVLAGRPDIIAANARLEQATSLKQSDAASIFPSVNIAGMYGVAESVLVSSTTVWSFGASTAVSLLDFGRIQGRIDASSAREVQAYESWKKTVLQAVQDVETSLTNVSHLQEQRISLKKTKDHAATSLKLAKIRYHEGDVSLLDVLDAERQVIEADNQLINAESLYSASVIGLYKALGQY